MSTRTSRRILDSANSREIRAWQKAVFVAAKMIEHSKHDEKAIDKIATSTFLHFMFNFTFVSS